MYSEELVGRLVFSGAGRDQGRPLLIIKLLNDKLVVVVDGSLRTLEKPKLKNLRHLRVTNRVAVEVVDKIARGDPLSNTFLRQAIRRLVNEEGIDGKGGLEND